MLAWARARLATLEATVDPQNLNDDLNSKKLFPEMDDLADPLGSRPVIQRIGNKVR
jgi:hypothetical protein